MSATAKTEERIKEAAKKVFTRRGLAGARMQEIADEANINKAMLHYYFKSKQHLFDLIFEEKLEELLSTMAGIMLSDLPFEDKIRQFVAEETQIISEFPLLPIFVLHEAWQNPEMIRSKIDAKKLKAVRARFKEVYDEATAAQVSAKVPFEQFMMNMISMIIYPHIARPVVQHVLGLTDATYKRLLTDRVALISDMLLQNVPKA